MSVSINEAKAPYVVFETKAIEDRDESIKQGHYMTKDVDFAIVTPAGSKDRIENIVTEWFDHLASEVRNGRFPDAWLSHYKASYREWKAGNELPIDGTPIKSWPMLSPAQRSNLLNWKVMTVEQLAEANEEVIGRLGMGGRALKQQAVAYLQVAGGQAGKVAAQVTDLQARLDSLEEANKLLREQNQSLAASAVQTPAASRELKDEVRQEEGLAGGLLDNDKPAAPRKL